MLPLMLVLTAVLAASALVDARTFRAGGVVTGSGRAPPPQQEHSGEFVYFLWGTFVTVLVYNSVLKLLYYAFNAIW